MKMRCSACRQSFPWNPKNGWPEYCPNDKCGVFIGIDPDSPEVVMPFIRSAGTKSVDKVYRDIESGSEVRAKAAAEMAGTSVDEMSGLKITNLRDQKHEGDVAAVPVNNAVSRAMDSGIGGFQGPEGSQYKGAVRSGPFSNQGAKTLMSVQRQMGVSGGRIDGT